MDDFIECVKLWLDLKKEITYPEARRLVSIDQISLNEFNRLIRLNGHNAHVCVPNLPLQWIRESFAKHGISTNPSKESKKRKGDVNICKQ